MIHWHGRKFEIVSESVITVHPDPLPKKKGDRLRVYPPSFQYTAVKTKEVKDERRYKPKTRRVS